MRPNAKITPPCKPDYPPFSHLFKLITNGKCKDGTYTEIYQPLSPYIDNNGRKKVVVYLHGFCLGPSQIYRTHILHLVHQGYYVIYPNYQSGFCKFPKVPFGSIAHLIQEMLSPDLYDPKKELDRAVKMTYQAYQTANLIPENVDTFLFGHSLGGLFALSWESCHQDTSSSSIKPKQIVVADPVPDSQSNIPPEIRKWIKHKFVSTVAISDLPGINGTGKYITVPVAILHGNDDTIVPVGDWGKPFLDIASRQKALYMSSTDNHGFPPLKANHEQAAVDTTFVSDSIAQKFLGGVGTEDNLNWRYIWYALDNAIAGTMVADLEFHMDKWSDGTDVRAIQRLVTEQDFEKYKEKIGVLLASYGDIQSLDELEPYFKRSLMSFMTSSLPSCTPKWLKNLVYTPLINFIWSQRRDEVIKSYEAFGVNTHYHDNSYKQAQLIQSQLKNEARINASVYVGFNFAHPYMEDTLAQIQAAGITKLIIINQGAAYSTETTQRNFDEALAYLKKHRQWGVKLIGVKSFAKDPRFVNLLIEDIKYQLKQPPFTDKSASDVCVFLPIHGVPMRDVRAGDPYIKECESIVSAITQSFPDYLVMYGYQNHQFSKYFPWTYPSAEDVAQKIAYAYLQNNVLINGKISFTVDCSETLGDQGIELRQIIEANNKKVVVTPMFNDDKDFAIYTKDLIVDVWQGQGDIIYLN